MLFLCHTQNHRKSGKVSDDKTSENSGVSFELPVVRNDLLNPHILYPNSNRCITDWFQEICGKIMVQKRGNIASQPWVSYASNSRWRPSLPHRSKFMRPLRYLHNVTSISDAWQVIVYTKLSIPSSKGQRQENLIQTKIRSGQPQ